jgi:hypothetical protein
MAPALAGQDHLGNLAAEIVGLHLQAQSHMASCAEAAMEVGDRLRMAKLEVGHGQFGDWVERNCKFNARRAREYMAIAADRPRIEAAMQCHGMLSFRALLRISGGGATVSEGETGDGAAEINQRPSLRQEKRKATTSHDIMAAWMDASPEERRRFIQSAGHEITDAMPATISVQAEAIPAPADRDDLAIPEDLSIPTFLRRQVAGPKLSDTAYHCATLGWGSE